MLDRADFPRDKCCGDGIAPHVLDVLTSLGLPESFDDYRPVHRLHRGYLNGAGKSASGRMAGPARVVPREVFDARLVAAAVGHGAPGCARTPSAPSRCVPIGWCWMAP